MIDEAPRRSRRVFVLGQAATLELKPVVRRVVADGAELVLLSMGYPVSAGQEALVGDALRLADELRLWLDTVLVLNPEEAAALILSDDDVTVLATAKERKRFERALSTRVRVRTGEGLAMRRAVRPAAIPSPNGLRRGSALGRRWSRRRLEWSAR
jgi:hypothetical protein